MLGRDLQNDRQPAPAIPVQNDKVVSRADNREDELVGDSEQSVEEQGHGYVAGQNQNSILKNADDVLDRYKIAKEVDREKEDQEKKNKQKKD